MSWQKKAWYLGAAEVQAGAFVYIISKRVHEETAMINDASIVQRFMGSSLLVPLFFSMLGVGCSSRSAQYYHGATLVTYRSYPKLIGIPLDQDSAKVLRLIDSLGLVDVTLSYTGRQNQHSWILQRSDGQSFDRFDCDELRVLRAHGIAAGPICSLNDREFTVFSSTAMLVFKNGISYERRQAVLSTMRIAEMNLLRYTDRTIQIEFDPGTGEGIHDYIRSIMDAGLVSSVNVVLYGERSYPLSR